MSQARNGVRSNFVNNAPLTTSLSLRPLIGITTRAGEHDVYYLRRYYAEAVEAAGGVPVYLPLLAEPGYWENLTVRLDGLVLSGSNSDLDPDYYGEEPHPRLGDVIPERDRADLRLLELAEASSLPLLGICFGMQSLNVSRGGSLIQDIESRISDPIKHQQGERFDRPSHYVALEPGSLLWDLAGGERARVNSSHHQAIDRVGRDLRVTARAADGVIEAVEDTRPHRFALGVQWHPEIGWRDDAFSRAIFRRLIEAAAATN